MMPEYLEVTVDKFLFRVAGDRRYSAEGVWALAENGRVRLGLTDYVQQLNGDAAFVHLKPVGTVLAVGDEFVELETIKATVSGFAPVRGTIVEINTALDFSPELVNQEPYGKGWLVTLEPVDWETDSAALLNAPAYLAAMQQQAEKELQG